MNRKLRIAGINVRLSASQLDDAGGTLAALTRELTGLAALSGERAASVVSEAEALSPRIAAIGLSLEALEAASPERGINDPSPTDMSDTFKALGTLFAGLTSTLLRVSRARDELARTSDRLLQHAAMRNGVGFIRRVLDEVDSEFTSIANAHRGGASDARRRLYTYMLLCEEAGSLAGGWLERSQVRISELSGVLSPALESLSHSARELARMGDSLDGEPLRGLTAQAEALGALDEVLQRRMGAAAECGNLLSELREPLFSLEELLANLASVDHRLRNLVVMMRIEMPRLVGLDDPGGLIQGVNNCHTQFLEFLDVTEQALDQFRTSMGDMKRTLNSIKKQRELIFELATCLRASSHKVVEAGRVFFEHCQELVSESAVTLDVIAQSAEALARLTDGMSALEQARQVCEQLVSRSRDARAALELTGLSSEGAEGGSGRLRQLVSGLSRLNADLVPAAQGSETRPTMTL